MYNKQKSIGGQASASMLPNNLSVSLHSLGADILFIHKSAAHLLLNSKNAGDSTDNESVVDGYIQRSVVCKVPTANQQVSYVLILQADWVHVANRRILVLATQKGIKMYDGNGSTLIHWHGFGAGGESVVFTRGIASIGRNTMCIGSSSGQILVFSVPSQGANITFEEYLAGHQHSVTAMVAVDNKLVSSNENGDIVTHRHLDGTSFKLDYTIEGKGVPCNAIDVWEDVVVAGYSNGELKLYSLSDGRLLGVIGAHAKSINALHIAQDSGRCVSAGEDSFVRVWELRSGGNVEVTHLYSERITDHQLVGAKFLDKHGRLFAVTAYDSPEVFTFSQS